MIQASLRIVPPAGKWIELRNVMRSLKGPTEVSHGCCECRVLQDAADEGALTYLVQWESLTKLEEHIRSARFRKLLPYIETSVQPPEFDVSSIDRIGGIESLIAVLDSNTGGGAAPKSPNPELTISRPNDQS